MTDQLDTAAIRARSQQPGYLEGQALQDVHALCDALDAERRARAVMQANVRETWQALCTMRNHLNEHLPMPSLESDLLQGPENSVFCTAVAEAVVNALAALRDESERLRAALKPCVKMLDDLVSESGRGVDWGHEDAFRMGEWFEAHDMDAIGTARAALAQKEGA